MSTFNQVLGAEDLSTGLVQEYTGMFMEEFTRVIQIARKLEKTAPMPLRYGETYSSQYSQNTVTTETMTGQFDALTAQRPEVDKVDISIDKLYGNSVYDGSISMLIEEQHTAKWNEWLRHCVYGLASKIESVAVDTLSATTNTFTPTGSSGNNTWIKPADILKAKRLFKYSAQDSITPTTLFISPYGEEQLLNDSAFIAARTDASRESLLLNTPFNYLGRYNNVEINSSTYLKSVETAPSSGIFTETNLFFSPNCGLIVPASGVTSPDFERAANRQGAQIVKMMDEDTGMLITVIAYVNIPTRSIVVEHFVFFGIGLTRPELCLKCETAYDTN